MEQRQGVGVEVALLGVARRKRRNRWLDFVVRLFREKPLAATGLVIVVVLLATAILRRLSSPPTTTASRTSKSR